MSTEHRMNRRSFLRFAAIAAAGTTLFACVPVAPAPEEKPEAEAPEAPVAVEEPVTIAYWHIWGGVRIEQMDEVLKDFMEANPKIVVEPLLLPNPGYKDKIITALAGDAPDITMIYTDEFAPSAKRGALMAVDDFMDRDGVSADTWYAGQWAMTQWDGKACGLPFVGNFLQFTYWNKDDFAAKGYDPEVGPLTWEETLAMAKELTVLRDDGSIEHLGCDTGVGGGWGGGTYRNGGNWFGDGTPDTVAINSDASLAAMEFVKSLYDVQGGYDAVGLAREDWANAQAGNPLIAGLSSALNSGIFTVNVINKQKPDLNYKLGKVPHGPQGEFLDLTVAAWNNCIPKKSPHPEQAWELAKYMSAGDGHLKFMVQLQGRPAMVKEYNMAPYDAAAREKNPYWDEVLEVLNGKHMSWPVSDKLGEAKRITSEAFGLIMLGESTIEEAADWAQEEVVSVFAED